MATEYICKVCGGNVKQFSYTSDPPINVMQCTQCGREIERKQEFPERVEV